MQRRRDVFAALYPLLLIYTSSKNSSFTYAPYRYLCDTHTQDIRKASWCGDGAACSPHCTSLLYLACLSVWYTHITPTHISHPHTLYPHTLLPSAYADTPYLPYTHKDCTIVYLPHLRMYTHITPHTLHPHTLHPHTLYLPAIYPPTVSTSHPQRPHYLLPAASRYIVYTHYTYM